MEKIKELKCPGCNKKAEIFLVGKKVIIKCRARKPCNYINRRVVIT